MKNFALSQLVTALPLLLLAGCQQPSSALIQATPLNHPTASASWQSGDASTLVSVSEKQGMQLRNHSGNSQLAGEFDQLSVKRFGHDWVAATLDERANSITIASFSENAPLQQQLQWRLDKLQPDSLCLFRDAQNRTLSLFVQDGASHAQQWLLAQDQQWLNAPLLMRDINQPQKVAACAVDDNHGWLYTLEEGIGIWRTPARLETTAERTPVAQLQPWGTLSAEPKSLTTDEQGNLFAIDEAGKQLMYWSVTALQQASRQQKTPHTALSMTASDTETLSASVSRQGQSRIIINRDDGSAVSVELASASSAPEAVLPMVHANAETPPADRTGDVMDDPAIWVNPVNPQQSRILGTHKKDGLYVYDLDAKLVSRFGDGKLNNVDVRDGFSFNGETIGLAAASKREDDSLMFYGLRHNGDVFRIGKQPSDLAPIYGLCMGKIDGKFYVFANDKTGRIDQYLISANNGELTSQRVRRLSVASQPEGCAVDDERGRLFVGEEDVAVWTADAHQDASTELSKVADVGPALVADIEGMEITSGEHPLLVVSSQGNDSYAVFDGIAPYAYRGSFRIGLDAHTGIDGASETDGLDVVSTPVGSQYPHGLLVVQDGRNRLPDEPQNFKYVDWNTVLKTLAITPANN
ncbi:phytase [Shewanella sp. C32]|uniref:Phytase n=1 Tax=Shewanella electrica TaxID=515560 RepID=A0ABT2FLE7_9GAMM|nr:phytase [Shewanella electrica]MCH1925534.1 phytase [Shewanella electrica]MCS4557159.1 phytase [Shewanella electrica]